MSLVHEIFKVLQDDSDLLQRELTHDNLNVKHDKDIENDFKECTGLDIQDYLEQTKTVKNYIIDSYKQLKKIEKQLMQTCHLYKDVVTIIKRLQENEHPSSQLFAQTMSQFFKSKKTSHDFVETVKQYTFLIDKIEFLKKNISTPLQQTNMMPMCKICHDNVIDTIALPCGHTYCSNCISHESCFWCRRSIVNTKPIFL